MENQGYRGRLRSKGRGRGAGGDENRNEGQYWRVRDRRSECVSVPGGVTSSGSVGQSGSTDRRGYRDAVVGGEESDMQENVASRGSRSVSFASATAVSQSSQGKNRGRVPIKRPDDGGRFVEKQRMVQVNHFLVKFDCNVVILQYDIEIKHKIQSEPSACPKVSKCQTLLVKNEYLHRQFPQGMVATAYDGERNIYSAIQLPQGIFEYEVSGGANDKPQTYSFTIKLVKQLELSRLKDYLQNSNCTLPVPRDILQALDVIFKENPSRCRIQVGKLYYPKRIEKDCELRRGIVAARGLQQSLKPTCQGLALRIDYCVNAFRKKTSVLQFLKEHLGIDFSRVSPTPRDRARIEKTLKNLRVTVTHRKTNQKYVVVALREVSAKIEKFFMDDLDAPSGQKEMGILEYFKLRYKKVIKYENLPCLDLSKNHKTIYVPMEFCELVEAQKYVKEDLTPNQRRKLRDLALAKPQERKDHICQFVKADDGPCRRDIFQPFKVVLDPNMTEATGRVIRQPDLKIRNISDNEIQITPKDKCQWNFVNSRVMEGKRVDSWGILDFSSKSRTGGEPLHVDEFIATFVERCSSLGIHMGVNPLFIAQSNMEVLDNPPELRAILERMYSKARGRLQILLCPMTDRHPGYKNLKIICETEIGIVTQCCRSSLANRLDDQYLVNLALKINMKVGGTNVELCRRLPGLHGHHHFMFIGADVNHPTGQDREAPSIAAVAATINWPAANKYAARFRLQKSRTERIEKLGEMCLELIESYARMNKVKPEKIILFRDGVSESQFDMVLNEELTDIKNSIFSEGYSPTITLVVAQKRHQTRLFLGNGNIEPGTVVDRKIVHPFEFDFYLCSHYGSMGTSKPTHYYVLWDEHSFTSDQLQQIIYHMCYTFGRCTKPVSLVPPVYYADIVAYRGRLYYEAWAQSHSPASTVFSSPSSMSSSSSGFPSQALVDINTFPKLHSELENRMFFA